jgi:peptide/nickel transport system permease protein
MRRLLANRAAMIALGTIVFLVLVALLAPVLPIQSPRTQNLRNRLQGPSGEHWLGTDLLGRDMFSRLIWATRTSLWAAAQAVFVAVLIGVPLGLIAGYAGGWIDAMLSRVNDVLMALPGIILGLSIIAVLGPGLTNAMLAIGVIMAPTFYRIARATSSSSNSEVYIVAARAAGCGRGRILYRHVLPNAMSPLLVQMSFAIGVAIVAEASLSFLGLGVLPPQASWGSMIAEAYRNLRASTYHLIPPTVAMAVAILAFATLGDALRDAIGRDSSRTA